MEPLEKVFLVLEQFKAEQAASDLVLSALIATHPRYEEFQMLATSLLEVADGPAGPWSWMNLRQHELARDRVEWLQAVHSKRPPSPAAG